MALSPKSTHDFVATIAVQIAHGQSVPVFHTIFNNHPFPLLSVRQINRCAIAYAKAAERLNLVRQGLCCINELAYQ